MPPRKLSPARLEALRRHHLGIPTTPKKRSESAELRAAAKLLFPKMKMSAEEKEASRAEGARKRRELKEAAALDKAEQKLAERLAQAERRRMPTEQLLASRAEAARKRAITWKANAPQREAAQEEKQRKLTAEWLERLRLREERFPPPPRNTSEPGDDTHAEAIKQDQQETYRAWQMRKIGVELKYAFKSMMLRLDWNTEE